MSTLQELEQAILALEAQRVALGEDVAQPALAVLREKLAYLQGHSAVAQHEQTAVLVADLSGFTALSEWRDAEEVRDTINAVWQKLDSVIESWGGNIDKHVGDGVIALFGLPAAGDHDPARAIQAALDMQMELALFNEQSTQEVTQGQFSWSAPPARLQMRIGIHMGPVLLGKVGTSGDYTAVGDAVKMAHQLERLAPIGGILISNALYQHVQPLFDVQPLELGLLDGAQESGQFYVVKREKPGAFRFTVGGAGSVAGALATRLVGRTEELQRLQEALQTTIDSGMAQVVTVIGEAGAGKSRLLFEFEKLLALLPEPVALFKGRGRRSIDRCSLGYRAFCAAPYALVRDLFVNYFDIHPRNSPAVAREKLVRGVTDVLGNHQLGNHQLGNHQLGNRRLGNRRLGNRRLGNRRLHAEGARARERAHFIGHLLGFNFADSPYLQGIQDEVGRIREYGFQDIAHFFKACTECSEVAVSGDCPAVVLFLEDIHLADEASFDLIDYLVRECRHVPLLVVCLARPSLIDKRPSWRLVESLDTITYQRLELRPLSAIDSRHLVTDILHRLPKVPIRLIDWIVNSAGGNPFYIEELVKMLMAEGVIVESPHKWRVDMTRLADIEVPPPASPRSAPVLVTLWQSRLSHLSPAERTVLEKAAVAGPVFWDTQLLQLGQTADVALSAAQLNELLRRLEEKEWIVQRKPILRAGPESILNPRRARPEAAEGEEGMARFAGMQAYIFRHDRLREAVYDTVPDARRRRYHAQVAAWIIAHINGHIDGQVNGDENDGYHPHDNQGVTNAPGHAGLIARHFEQAEDSHQAATWYGRAARQAEISHAPETAIYYYCQALNLLPLPADGQPAGGQPTVGQPSGGQPMVGQRLALNEGLGQMLRRQARFSDAVDAFKAMRAAARAIEDAGAEVRALLELFWAYACQEEYDAALESAAQAERIASSAPSHLSLEAPGAAAVAAKGWALLSLGDVNGAVKAAKEALALSTDAAASPEIAYSNLLLGDIGRASGYYDKAVQHTETALRLFRESSDRLWEGVTLAQLARIAQSRGDETMASARYRESLRLARSSGDNYGTLLALRQLGRLACRQEQYAQAEEQYQQALVIAEKCGNIAYRTALANDLGELHLALAISMPAVTDLAGREDHLQQAYAWFERALRLAREDGRARRLLAAQTGLARLYLEDEQPDEALGCLQEVIDEAERSLQLQPDTGLQKELAAAWRVAGLVAARLPWSAGSPIIGGQPRNARACYTRSLQLLEEIGPAAAHEKAQTLRDWSALELSAEE